jgi:hypothetical protein
MLGFFGLAACARAVARPPASANPGRLPISTTSISKWAVETGGVAGVHQRELLDTGIVFMFSPFSNLNFNGIAYHPS